MTVKIATWNVNSVRIRLDSIRQVIDGAAPDVLCLQEIKVQTDLFPGDFFRDLGYEHQIIHGQKAYHGVAILSRLPLSNGETRDWWGKADARHAFCRLPGGIELHNFYVPAGGDVPDPETNDKFAHKLGFLDEMADYFSSRNGGGGPMILVGDLNIAPLETDVWSHKQLLKVVSHTPVEVAALARVARSRDWIDAVRHFIPPEEKLYSWWSYRARDWSAADKGRRLDHVWVTPDLRSRLRSAAVLREIRGLPSPSDHAPVIVELQTR